MCEYKHAKILKNKVQIFSMSSIACTRRKPILDLRNNFTYTQIHYVWRQEDDATCTYYYYYRIDKRFSK